MSSEQIDAVVARLVAQFSSPYDFLRELVQNSVDAGSDLVDVRLYAHEGDDPGGRVFELMVADAGVGMDETIIDTQLTRLFSSAKTDDRTTAGGFGIGFVSVFAWQPQRVVVQTGRRDEAWELIFHGDHQFEKHRLEDPAEGTVIRLFRAGDASERPSIAAAVEESLRRWCRYCHADIAFENVGVDAAPRVIAADRVPTDAVVSVERVNGETTLRAALTPTPRVTFLRHALVLAEGEPKVMLSGREGLDAAAPHLWAWADSPRLTTSMARDEVVRDPGREAVEHELWALVPELLAALVDRAEAVARDQGPSPLFSQLHAHLHLEHEQLPAGWLDRSLLREAAGEAVSATVVSASARSGVAGVVPPGTATPHALGHRVAALRAGVPVLAANWATDRDWLAPTLALVDVRVAPLRKVCSRVTDVAPGVDALSEALLRLIRQLGVNPVSLQYGAFVDAELPPLLGVGTDAAVASCWLSWSAVDGQALWLGAVHPLVTEARAAFFAAPSLAVLGLAQGIAACFRAAAPAAQEINDAWIQQ